MKRINHFRRFLPPLAVASAIVTSIVLAQENNKNEKSHSTGLSVEIDHTPIQRISGPTTNSYAPMLAEAKQAVVSVHTSEVVRTSRRSGSLEEEILRQLFGQSSSPSRSNDGVRKIPQGVGSGVIISPDGYILTNNHVVQDQRGGEADEIMVRLNDQESFPATLVGRDPRTDIAVLKVEATNLPYAKIADSEQVMVGDIVFAIGNPLGVGLTVTSGIISAKDRSIGIYGEGGIENFLQTDASINQGNSGGALVDIQGRLIGVNSAILSNSNGGSIGIGFAIPSNLAIDITERLTETGNARSGLIGIRTTDLTPEMADALEIPGKKGSLVEEVIAGLPAEKAGVQHGDLVIQINEQKIGGYRDLRLALAAIGPKTEIKMSVLRDGQKKDFTIITADPDAPLAEANDTFIDGVKARMIDDQLRQQFRLPTQANGLVVTQVNPSSPFARYLQPGVAILEINRKAIRSVNHARELLRTKENNLLYVLAEGRTSYFAVRLE